MAHLWSNWHPEAVPTLEFRAIRWVSDEPQPGIVEAETDGPKGHVYHFLDKAAVFSDLGPDSNYPLGLALPVEVLAVDGLTALVRLPHSLEDTTGANTISVPRDLLSD